MSKIHVKMREKVGEYREKIKKLNTDHGDTVISQVTVRQLLGGQRGVKSLLCDTSIVPPETGLLIRGIPILDLVNKLPEEVYWLLLTGDLPSKEELRDFQDDLKSRPRVPDYTWAMLHSLPGVYHPMAAFNTLLLSLERHSKFRKQYTEGMPKEEHWYAMLEDSLDIIALIPELAAGVYRARYELGNRIPPDRDLDWGANYANMLGIEDTDGSFAELIRLYMVLHSDHESGNVSAHTAHCVASSLADPYYAVSAGLNGLAGPLHGLANQQVLMWLLGVLEKFGGNPSKAQLEEFVHETLNSGQVIPGYGHAVLRVVDPRFTAIMNFGKQHCPNGPVFKLAQTVFEVVPDILKGIHKISDPWPNVDSISGSLLYQCGVTQHPFYTVFFAVSRALGMTAQIVWSRVWNESIERPKSVNFETLEKLVMEAEKGKKK